MKRKPKPARKWLEANAKAVARALKSRSAGTAIRVRLPRGSHATNTSGWNAKIGDLGKGKPSLEIWLDRFSGYPERKLWACFAAWSRPTLVNLTKRIRKELWPVRVITVNDTEEDKFLALKTPLKIGEFNAPILERHPRGETYFGIYSPTDGATQKVTESFCAQATAFFEDVARSLPHAAVENEHSEVFPRFENRKTVTLHLRRERSKLLADSCKRRDNYKCQVCGLRFVELYGKYGKDFAEAHHVVALSKLRENLKRSVDDLITVCANCHRMLHRMDGNRNDVRRLTTIVQKHRLRPKPRPDLRKTVGTAL